MVRKQRRQPKSALGRLWNFIWNDDSLASWIVNIVLAFVIIKFLVYPGLGMLFGTSYPLVAVISGSMYHGLEGIADPDSDSQIYRICSNTYSDKAFSGHSFDRWWQECGDWYEDRNITKEEFKKYPLENGFDKGDIILLRNADSDRVGVGDIIVFWPKEGTVVVRDGKKVMISEPVIHRVIDIDEKEGEVYYTTKGDHNPGSGSLDEEIPADQVIGRAWAKVPYIGYLKVWAFEVLTGIRSVF